MTNSSPKDKPESRRLLRDRLRQRREARKQRKVERARLARENPTPRTTPGASASALVAQQVRFCTAGDGVGLAYAVHGSGPPMVRAATWLTHLDFDWESPVWRHWLAELSDGHTLVRYDERGCGLSDRELGELPVET